uniref:Ig-like domain-containing protein n=1 Tax=Kryptolebias marmoratus TaxID=37003 RepID=A0A3Q3BKP8_KRYMA
MHFCSVSTDGPDVPRIDVTPYSITERGYSALERETVSLMCQAQSNPASQYVWFYNNSQVYAGPQYTITKVLRMHTGDYASSCPCTRAATCSSPAARDPTTFLPTKSPGSTIRAWTSETPPSTCCCERLRGPT